MTILEEEQNENIKERKQEKIENKFYEFNYMSQSLVNQITIDCLLNREAMGEHVMKQREKQINKIK
jgi:hypothetical protein